MFVVAKGIKAEKGQMKAMGTIKIFARLYWGGQIEWIHRKLR